MRPAPGRTTTRSPREEAPMGRTFDAIRLAQATRPETDEPAVTDREAEPTPLSLTLPDLPTDAPYIEVGRQAMTASADVLAAGPRPVAAAGPRPQGSVRFAGRPTDRPVANAGTLPA